MERSPKADLPIPLNYATPRIFFRGRYQCRNWLQLGGCIGLFAFAAMFAFAALQWRSVINSLSALDDIPILSLLAVACALLSLAFLAASAYVIWTYVEGREWSVLITEDVISRAGRLREWREIERVYAVHFASGVNVEFILRHASIPLPRAVELHPLLSAEQYSNLARILQEHVVPRHPHLKVDPQAMHSSS